jgi:transcriptional regulator with XRE-family HTH domain
MPTLGEQIAADRKGQGMTQKDLAAQVLKEDGEAISPQFLNDIERDRRKPSHQVLARIAEVLKKNVDEYHLLAGQLPPDLLRGSAEPDRLKEVMRAFRKTYTR